MCYRCILVFYPFVVAPFLEFSEAELQPIVGDYHRWDTEAAHDLSFHKVYDPNCGNGCKWSGFYPFGEVVDDHYQKLHISFSGDKRPDEVYSPFIKGSRTGDSFSEPRAHEIGCYRIDK
jgi:hypothetical protein